MECLPGPLPKVGGGDIREGGFAFGEQRKVCVEGVLNRFQSAQPISISRAASTLRDESVTRLSVCARSRSGCLPGGNPSKKLLFDVPVWRRERRSIRGKTRRPHQVHTQRNFFLACLQQQQQLGGFSSRSSNDSSLMSPEHATHQRYTHTRSRRHLFVYA